MLKRLWNLTYERIEKKIDPLETICINLLSAHSPFPHPEKPFCLVNFWHTGFS